MLLVDQHGIGERANLLCRLNGVFGQIRLGFKIFERINPWAGVFCAACVLSDGDDLKFLSFNCW